MIKLAMRMATLGCGLAINAGAATDVILALKGSGPVKQLYAHFRCDAAGPGIGLPSGTFTVRYVQSGDTSLAVLPVKGQDLVFAQVISASGGRYVTGRLTWWDAREPMFLQDADAKDRVETKCRRVD